ncbi:MAG: DEAD/DEAH box helicase [Candidatus Diapherotrites archaeon]|nr:DEAD/DEAH box helicase [Candidatus Diapherotrites archaeon]
MASFENLRDLNVKLPPVFLKNLEKLGISKLNRMQELAVSKGLLDEKSMVVSAPTASGKTLLALLRASLDLEKGRKVILTVPLKALAQEHFEEFSAVFSGLFKVVVSTGDLDSQSAYLQDYDVIVTTYEKMDSILRHKPKWLESVGLLVVDEVHEIDSDRGSTLEMVITKMRLSNPKIGILALSATIPNPGEIASWIGAPFVESVWRPVKLVEGVYVDGKINFVDGQKAVKVKKDDVLSIVSYSISDGGQCLVFVDSRRSAESIAVKLSKELDLGSGKLNQDSKDPGFNLKELELLSEKVAGVLSPPTVQCKKLAQCVSGGVSFHHAGLVSEQRKLVEGSFKKNVLKVIVATPTLAAGVNLPARRVVHATVSRFTDFGHSFISVREYRQRAGRAGRPRFDDFGESVLVAKNDLDAKKLFDRFIFGKVEPVYSRLGNEPVLRTHVLSMVAGSHGTSKKELFGFFSKTFYASQYGDLSEMNSVLDHITGDLEEWGFVSCKGEDVNATPLGLRVSMLCIDPLSAKDVLDSLFAAQSRLDLDIAYLFMLCDTKELYPLLSVSRKQEEAVWEKASEFSEMLFRENVFEFDVDALKKFFTAMLLESWILGESDELILKKYNVAPGIVHAKVSNAQWMAYAARELARLSKLKKIAPRLSEIETRLRFGVKKELLQLVALKGIGRVRARQLFNAGFKTKKDILAAPVEGLSRIVGPAVAVKLKRELGVTFSGSEVLELKKKLGKNFISLEDSFAKNPSKDKKNTDKDKTVKKKNTREKGFSQKSMFDF